MINAFIIKPNHNNAVTQHSMKGLDKQIFLVRLSAHQVPIILAFVTKMTLPIVAPHFSHNTGSNTVN